MNSSDVARGADSVTHRAVAAEAEVPLSATTYYFDSKEQLLEHALLLAAREETERLERLVLDLAPRSLSVGEWAQAVASVVGGSVRDDPATQVALFELGLESTRTPTRRAELVDWQAALLRLAEMGCRSVGSDEPALDATVVVAAIAGLMMSAYFGSARTDLGATTLLPAVTAAVLGGASIYGGTGSVLGTVLATFLIGYLQQGLQMAGVPSQISSALSGALLVIVVAIRFGSQTLRAGVPGWPRPGARRARPVPDNTNPQPVEENS